MDYDFEQIMAENQKEMEEEYQKCLAKIKDGSATSSEYISAVLCLKDNKNADKSLINDYLDKGFLLANREMRETDIDAKIAGMYSLVQYYTIKKEYKKAAEYYEELIKLDPEMTVGYVFFCKQELKNKKKAKEVYEYAKSRNVEKELLSIMESSIKGDYDINLVGIYIIVALLFISVVWVVVSGVIELFM